MKLLRGLGWQVWAVLAVALVLRVAVGEYTADRVDMGTDARDYARIGLSIANGDGYPTGTQMTINGGPSAIRPPGYPYFLAGIFAVTGDSETAARLVGAVLGTLTVAIMGLIAWQLWARRRIALAAMALTAIYPPFLTLSATLMSEALFFPLMLGALAAVLQQRKSAGLRWALLAGLLTGLALLTRTAGLALLPPLMLVVWNRRPILSREALAPAAVVLAAAVLVLAPWTVRNAREFHAFVPVSTQGGMSLAGAYNEESRADPAHFWRPPPSTSDYVGLYRMPGFDEQEQSRELTDRSLEFIEDHPAYLVEFAWHNLGRLVEVNEREPTRDDVEGYGLAGPDATTTTFSALFHAGWIAFYAIVALAIAGAVMGRAAAFPRALWLIPLIAVLTSVVLVGLPRYRLVADVFLILLAAPVVAAIFSRLTSRGETAAPQPVA